MKYFKPETIKQLEDLGFERINDKRYTKFGENSEIPDYEVYILGDEICLEITETVDEVDLINTLHNYINKVSE